MRSLFHRRWWLVLAISLIAGAAVAIAAHRRTGPATLILSVDHDLVPANGYAQPHVTAHASDGRELRTVLWRVENGKNLTDMETSTPVGSDFRTVFRAGVTPGQVQVQATATGLKPARISFEFALEPSDEFGDGTPDFLRLQDPGDRLAFRRWFTFLAESTYFQKIDDRPREVNDCAALIRYAYREALRVHDGPWANQWHLEHLATAASIRKYDYPHTALGANIFRTRPGAFAPDDIRDGAFAEFADAESLRRFNTHFVSRDLKSARPGDLIFFRQAGQRMPFHTMIYLGPSQFGEGDEWLIYHTGPSHSSSGNDLGELRRVTVDELMQHPYARWRPVPQNAAFLGVYRWNILREAN
jgi:uncharacterized protein YfaT (DUF1175 family)